MTEADSVAWLIWSLGFGMGFAYRVWGERRASRHDLPAWMARLGYSVAAQFKSVDDGHRFAGDDVTVQSRQRYSSDGVAFLVQVERAPVLSE